MQSIRGVQDFFKNEAEKFDKVISVAQKIAKKYNFSKLITPILEKSSLFERTLGEDTDVVSKEIYKFEDKGGEMIALRPEFTAGVVRAVCQNHELYGAKMPLKLFSNGQLFRYERPQSGRYREHNQINFEIFGKNSSHIDADLLITASEILETLEIKNISLDINFIGGIECKNQYISYLNEYFEKYKNELSEDSKKRLEIKKTLRILDSKNENDKKISENVLPISNFYSDETKRNIDEILYILNETKIEFKLEKNLVRGLDYYTDLVFEFTAHDLASKSQKAIMGGGRYDKMVSQISQNKLDLPAVGFGSGIERLMSLMKNDQEKPLKIAIIPYSQSQIVTSFKVKKMLNSHEIFKDFAKDIIFDANSMSKNIKKADEMGFSHICVIGEDEEKIGEFEIRSLSDKNEKFVIKI